MGVMLFLTLRCQILLFVDSIQLQSKQAAMEKLHRKEMLRWKRPYDHSPRMLKEEEILNYASAALPVRIPACLIAGKTGQNKSQYGCEADNCPVRRAGPGLPPRKLLPAPRQMKAASNT